MRNRCGLPQITLTVDHSCFQLLQERYQQLVCETKQQSRTSDTGGWCNSAVRSQHSTDKPLIDALAELFTGQTVVGLGDGRGEYRNLVLRTGKVRTYDAYDGAPNINNITGGQVSFQLTEFAVNGIHLRTATLSPLTFAGHLKAHLFGLSRERVCGLFMTRFINLLIIIIIIIKLEFQLSKRDHTKLLII